MQEGNFHLAFSRGERMASWRRPLHRLLGEGHGGQRGGSRGQAQTVQNRASHLVRGFVGAERGTHTVPHSQSASERLVSLLMEHVPPPGGNRPVGGAGPGLAESGAWCPISEGHGEYDISGDPET